MLEVIGVPILLKAVDFLFDESKNILNDRRERKKANGDGLKPIDKSPKVINLINGTITSKEEALKQPILESEYLKSEDKIKHLNRLLEIYIKNYYLAKEQYAKWGSAMVPPIIVNNLTEAEDNVLATTEELRSILSTIYNKKVIVDGNNDS